MGISPSSILDKMQLNSDSDDFSEEEISNEWDSLMAERKKDGQSHDDFKQHMNQQITSFMNKYKIIGNVSSTDKEYDTVAQFLSKYVIFEDKTITERDSPQEIRKIIKENVHQYKTLDEIQVLVKENFNIPTLNNIDYAYIKRKFLTYCLESFIQETIELFKHLVIEKKFSLIIELINSLNTTHDLTQIPYQLMNKYYKLLMDHEDVFNSKDESNFLAEIKRQCIGEILNFSDTINTEITFVEKVCALLNCFQCLDDISMQLQLKELCQGVITFKNFVDNINNITDTTYEDIHSLKRLAKNLATDDFFMIDVLKQELSLYLKPVLIEEKNIDGRIVIQITGKIITLSKIIEVAEKKLSENENIEEIHFTGSVFYVDGNLKNETFQEINIVVYTNILKITTNVIWDVSGKGKDNKTQPRARNGRSNGDEGTSGNDGEAGNSGGNVMILTDHVENIENLNVVSNGSDGTDGQDGGDGGNGKDGQGMRCSDFDRLYPPVAKRHRHLGYQKHEVTISTIHSTVKYYITDHDRFHGHPFINFITHEGYEVTYSAYFGAFHRAAFALVKGTEGHSGGAGGEGGLGGQGGYGGEILINGKTFGESRDGKNGNNGKGGCYGTHGRNGWDIGYVDYKWWDRYHSFGTDENSKLGIEYYPGTDVPPGSVWCAYKGKHAEIVNLGSPDRKITQYQERKTKRKDVDRQAHAQAIRKKAITEQYIKSTYSHQINAITKTKNDLLAIKNITMQVVQENKNLHTNQDTELVVKYHTSFINKSKIYRVKEATTGKDFDKTSNDYEEHINDLIELININPTKKKNWNEIKNVQLRDSHLNQVNSIFETIVNEKLSTSKKKLKYIECMLINKYRIEIYRNIANKLPDYLDVKNENEISSGNMGRYLIEADQNYKNISHNVLGTLKQYFNENEIEERQKISRFYSDSIRVQQNIDILKTTIKTFILGAGKSTNVHVAIKNYYQDFQEFLNQRKSKISKHFEEFKNEISKPEYADIMTFWSKSVGNRNIENILKEKIDKHNTLKELYNRFNEQLQEKYNWEKCCKDDVVFKEFKEYIHRRGAMSESYRELLAYAYNVNINVYIKTNTTNYSLRDSHNPSSTNKLHVLCFNNILLEMKIDEDYLLMTKDRIKRNKVYASIFTDNESLKTKNSLEEYFTKESYLSNEFQFNKEMYQEYLDYCRMHENEYINKIIKYFSTVEEKQNVKKCLKMISTQYIGQHGILHHLLYRFENEGRHISYEELYYIVNSILKSVVAVDYELNLYCWIIAAYPQEKWICELILLELENVFKKLLPDKSKWRQNLTDTKDVNILLLLYVKIIQLRPNDNMSIEIIGKILHLLSNIPQEIHDIEKLHLPEWLYALKEKYWKCKLNLLTSWIKENLELASYYLMSLETLIGNSLVDEFINILNKKDRLDEKEYLNILLRFQNEEWSLNKNTLEMLEENSIEEWINKMQTDVPTANKDRNVTQLVKLIQGNGNTSRRIKELLHSIETSIRETKSPEYSHNNRKIYDFTENDIKNWAEDFRKNFNDKENLREMYDHMFAVINRGIELKRRFKLRDTQSLSIMMLLQNKQSTLLQMLTGEGKTLIIVAATIIKVLCGEQVDIVTSSSVLAKRDAESSKDIYDLFGVKVSHNCSEDIEERKLAYANNDVVYGDLANFQRDYLLDRFYKENVLSNRKFENIFIDEVDSLLLDKGNNVLYLSRDIPGLDKLESVYIFIWQFICRPTADKDEFFDIFDTEKIMEIVVSDLYGLITKNEIKKLDINITERAVYKIWNILIDAKIIDMEGKLTSKNINYYKVEKLFSTEFAIYVDRIKFMLRQCAERDRFIKVPNYLKSFVLDHLETWIESAKSAMFMQERSDYIIDVDRSGTSSDIYPNVIILDKGTGTDQLNSQWDEALHQFLQLKHGCKLSLQSLKAVFISNVTFFKLYSKMYGVTGTLGSERERDLLKEIHNVDFVNVPTNKPKLFDETPPVLCSGINDWKDSIYNESLKIINEKRSVLVICETVKDVEKLYSNFKKMNINNVYKYTRDYEEHDITKGNQKLSGGYIIIATNLAGRGTDLKITSELNQAGGLHVILAYLPNNIRIERQAFGRAARASDKGSGQLVVMGLSDKGYDSSKVLDLKKERDVEELQLLSEIKDHYVNQIKTEEYCFREFSKQYEKWKSYIEEEKLSSDMRDVLLDSCLDRWSFWLDQNSCFIKTLKGEQLNSKIGKSLAVFISELNKPIEENNTDWSAWVHGPFQTIKLAKCLIDEGNINKAISLFNQVIQEEHNFSEMAHYYKAFAIAKNIDWESNPLKDEDEQLLKELKKELEKARILFDEHNDESIQAGNIIDMLKENDEEGIIPLEAYTKQKKSIRDLYSIFSKSIDNILGSHVTPDLFLDVDIKKDVAETIFNDLVQEGILTKTLVNTEIYEEKHRQICYEYGIAEKSFKSLISKCKTESMNVFELNEKIKEYVKLPSKETFWEILIENKVLIDEVVYVCINKEIMKDIDPSLLNTINNKINVKEITTNILEQNEINKLYLFPELIKSQNTDGMIIEYNAIKNILSENKYKKLSNLRAISLNKKASFKNIDGDSIFFPDFDVITPENFLDINISEGETEMILNYLRKEKILSSTDNIKHKLRISCDKIDDIELINFPIYENIVKKLLHISFVYRITFDNLKKQFEDNKIVSQINLMSAPYQSLFLDIINQNIITISKTMDNSAINKLGKDIYKKRLTINDVMFLLNKSDLFTENIDSSFIEHLIEKKWLTHVKYDANEILNPNLFTENIDSSFIEHFLIEKKLLTHVKYDVYEIQNTNERESLCGTYKDIEETTKMILNKYDILTKHTSKIADKIKKYSSVLEKLNVPDFKLKPMSEYIDGRSYGNVEELHLLTMNGVDTVIFVEEKRYTWKMIWNTIAVILMGIAQIAIGAVIEIFSAGSMTIFGGIIIGEGINDLLYAVNAFISGHFDWNDYGSNKLQSLIMSVVTTGVGVWISKGMSLARFGTKIAGLNFKIGGKLLAKQAGNQLIKNTGFKVVAKKVVSHILKKSVEGLTTGLVNMGIDALIESQIQSFCDSIGSEIFACVYKSINEHKINKTLDEVFEKLGEQRGMEMVIDLTDSCVAEIDHWNEISSRIFSIGKGILSGITAASKSGKIYSIPLKYIEKILKWGEKAEHITMVMYFVTTFFDKLNEQTLNKLKSVDKIESESHDESTKCEFKQNIIGLWENIFKEKIGHYITNDIVKPILQYGASTITTCFQKQITKKFSQFNKQIIIDKCGNLKNTFNAQMLEIKRIKEEMLHVVDHVKIECYRNLIKLLSKTKNPNLFATIVRENVPMDMTCVNVCSFAVKETLRNYGAENSEVTIIVRGEDGISKSFSTSPDDNESTIIELHLKNNHFQIHYENSINEAPHKLNNPKNSCLYDALPEELRRKMSAEVFRNNVADFIENDAQTHFIIKNNWCQFPLDISVWEGGHEEGKRNQVTPKSICDIHPLNVEIENTKQYQHEDWKFNKETDMDIRVTDSELNIMKQFTDGFNLALFKVNEEIEQKCPGFAIEKKEFKVTMFDTVLDVNKGDEIVNVAVELERNLTLKIDKVEYQYKVIIDCENPMIEKGLSGPHGPRVDFKITGPEKSSWKGTAGHILLNENKELTDRPRSRKYIDQELGLTPDCSFNYGLQESEDIVERYSI